MRIGLPKVKLKLLNICDHMSEDDNVAYFNLFCNSSGWLLRHFLLDAKLAKAPVLPFPQNWWPWLWHWHWGERAVTLCVAALCFQGDIVHTTDSKVTSSIGRRQEMPDMNVHSVLLLHEESIQLQMHCYAPFTFCNYTSGTALCIHCVHLPVVCLTSLHWVYPDTWIGPIKFAKFWNIFHLVDGLFHTFVFLCLGVLRSSGEVSFFV